MPMTRDICLKQIKFKSLSEKNLRDRHEKCIKIICQQISRLVFQEPQRQHHHVVCITTTKVPKTMVRNLI